MAGEEVDRELLEAFRAEAEESLQVLTTGLLALEEGADPRREETIEEVFRAAHSLKGAARAVDNQPVERAAGAWESIFSSWKRAGFAPPDAPFDLLHEMLSYVSALVDNPQSEEAERLRRAEERLSGAANESPIPSVPVGEKERRADERSGEPNARAAAPPAGEAAQSRESTIRVSHQRLNDLVLQADEVLSVKIASHQQALALRRLTENVEAILQRCQSFPSASRQEAESASGSSPLALLDHLYEEVREIARQMKENSRAASRAIDNLREKAQGIFMRPADSLLAIFPKTVRDLSRSQGKSVELVTRGGHLRCDQRILEGLTDPLMHLVRNAIDHGAEPAEERERQGKSRQARLEIVFSQPHPGRIDIAIRDDGGGLPVEAIRKKAVARSLLTEDQAQSATAERLTSLIFESGFSTRSEVSALSGRGLGLAIVREKIEQLGGHISLRTEQGAGATFLVSIPSALVVFRGLLLKVSGESFLLPAGQVEAVISFRPEQLVSSGDISTFRHQGEMLSVVELSDLLQIPSAVRPSGEALRQAVIISSTSERVALVVDEVVREEEFPVRSFEKPLVHLKGILGAATPPGQEALPVLQVAALLESGFNWISPQAPEAAGAPGGADAGTRATVLVAEDSITSRTLLKSILEGAGYKVVVTVDGRDALSALRLQPVNLVVSDVEMPRMDGFQLTAAIRKDPALRELPVVLVTALSASSDREKGLEAGASAYIVKNDFDQGNLLQAVQRLLETS